MYHTTFQLPDNFQTLRFLAFHQRDQLQVAEKVDGSSLSKGFMFNGNAALLTVQLHQQYAEVIIDTTDCEEETTALATLSARLLGLNQDIAAFEQQFKEHPEVGQLLTQHAGLRLEVLTTPFEALSWAIIGQQISLSAAISVRRKMIIRAAVKHATGSFCYPDAATVLQMGKSSLREAGLSNAKADALLTISTMIVCGELLLDGEKSAEQISALKAQLLQIKGIGPWTVNYCLMRGYGYLDSALEGDAAVRENLRQLLGLEVKPDIEQTRRWLNAFSPWRSLIAAHLWAFTN